MLFRSIEMYFYRILRNDKTHFVLISSVTTIMLFLRTIVTLKYLSFYDLGLVGMIQMIGMIVSICQLGIVTGGYYLSAAKPHKIKKLNECVTSNILFLTVIFLAGLGIYGIVVHKNINFLLIGSIIGGITLYSSWLTALVLAKGDLKTINKANAAAILLIVISIFFIKYGGIYVNVASLLLHPIIILVIILLHNKNFLVKSFIIDVKTTKILLSFGIIPFLTSMLSQVNIQIERWSVVELLGVEALGKLSLCFAFNSAFMILPSAIVQIYYPQAVKSYTAKDYFSYRLIIIRIITIFSIYCVLSIIISYFLLSPIVNYFFPKYLGQVYLIYVLLPGLIFSAFFIVFSTIFVIKRHYKVLVIVNIIGVVTYILGVIFFKLKINVELYNFVLLESVAAFITLFAGFLLHFYTKKFKPKLQYEKIKKYQKIV